MASQLLSTTRFGPLRIEDEDILEFPDGVIGLEDLRDWVLFADSRNPTLGWLQSLARADVALAVVSPRRYVPEYRVRVSRRELGELRPEESRDAHVLVIVSHNEQYVTLNLKAPIVVDLTRRLGRQVITKDEQPLQHELPYQAATLKKSA